MDRLFLDANVLFSAAYQADAGLLHFWKLKHAILCSSRYALEEARINLGEESQRRRLSELAEGIQLFDVGSSELSISLPDKDEPILLAAIQARATHLITGDVRHFGPYFGKTGGGIRILAPADDLRRRHGR